ncbi:MAG: GDP-mannose 4,6-dehydratase, partial [Planctomycetales bacterium]|nr:GDP-mannose 4,6-dehydratase [Planctomycetales bacterium]
TSEMFGNTPHSPQDEQTPFHPRSPYAIAKVFAHWTAVNYREAHGMFCTSGILFNHESPLRGAEFLTRKVSLGLARLAAGTDGALALGNLDSRRDWGFAGDYVEGMHRMLQADKADDFVLATGRNASVREFTTLAAEAAGRELEWDGEGIEARGIDRKTGQVVVKIDPRLFRPAEVNVLLGNYAKAKRELGWETKVS